jgi:cytochrome c553
MAHMPVLAGQKPGYLGLSLQLFRSGQRSSGIMRMMASRLSDDDIRRIATYFAGASRDVPPAQAPPQAIARGGTLAEKGDRAHDIPACRSCHGPQPERADPMIPDIRGQRADYIEEQLRLFKDGIRGNSKYARMMHEAAQSLHPDEMAALAAYYASLTPEPHFP